jgi:hypothetical protein
MPPTRQQWKDTVSMGATILRVREASAAMARRLFHPEGKNPYLKGGLEIHDLAELDRSLSSFDTAEAPWVADWLEYLGDAPTAERVRQRPADFREIIHARSVELRRFL